MSEIKPRIWTKEETFRLIEMLHGATFLWDSSLPDYKTGRLRRAKQIEKFAIEMQVQQEEIERKLHNLRTQFNNEIRKREKRKASGLPNLDIPWEYFSALSFLKGKSERIITKRTPDAMFSRDPVKTRSSDHQDTIEIHVVDSDGNVIHSGDGYDYESRDPDEIEIHSLNGAESDDVALTGDDNAAEEINWVEGKSLAPTIKNSSYSGFSEDSVLCKVMDIVNRPMDDHQVFGDYIATTMRSMNLEVNKRLLKRKMERLILEVTELDDEGIPAAKTNGITNSRCDTTKRSRK